VAFACAIPNTFAGVQTFHCEGAIAKTFKSLKVDLASTAPLMVKASTTGTVTKASFTGSSQLVQGASNALGVTVPNQTSTKILGAFTPVGTATISAGAVLPVTLFPTKVGWAVGDVAHAVSFKIAGLNNSYTVTLTGAKNPKNSIDATGTGTVVIGTKSVPVSLWTLQD
jgi:hypothetical protein